MGRLFSFASAWLYTNVPLYLVNDNNFETMFMNIPMCVLTLYTKFPCNISRSKITERYMIKMFIDFNVLLRYSCAILIILQFSGQSFEKSSNVKSHANQYGTT